MTSYFEKDKQNYYDVLDIPPDASQSDIRQAYFRAKSAYGKDSNAIYSLFDAGETSEMLNRIEEAYMILSNPDRRKEYDRTHGLLKGFDPVDDKQSKSPASRGAFSFAEPTRTYRQASSDPATQAASVVFGSESFAEDTTIATNRAQHIERLPSENLAPKQRAAFTMPSEDLFGVPSSNKLGPVRRVDLVKKDPQDQEMVNLIASETEYRGPFLRKVREYYGITLDELCEFTKISKSYLNCLEAEEFDSLPAPAYVRGFVLQVAKAIKLPHEKAAAGYMKHYYSVVGGN